MGKQTKTWIPVSLIAIFFLSLLISRPYLLEWISKQQRNQLSQKKAAALQSSINTLYNYNENGEGYDYTFLEFGSTSCTTCRNMERVMEQIKNRYPNTVKVVFINVVEKSNKELVKFYEIAAIPTQVLLDRSGNEYFRHTGFIADVDLARHFK